jgi:hypothetical protein
MAQSSSSAMQNSVGRVSSFEEKFGNFETFLHLLALTPTLSLAGDGQSQLYYDNSYKAEDIYNIFRSYFSPLLIKRKGPASAYTRGLERAFRSAAILDKKLVTPLNYNELTSLIKSSLNRVPFKTYGINVFEYLVPILDQGSPIYFNANHDLTRIYDAMPVSLYLESFNIRTSMNLPANLMIAVKCSIIYEMIYTSQMQFISGTGSYLRTYFNIDSTSVFKRMLLAEVKGFTLRGKYLFYAGIAIDPSGHLFNKLLAWHADHPVALTVMLEVYCKNLYLWDSDEYNNNLTRLEQLGLVAEHPSLSRWHSIFDYLCSFAIYFYLVRADDQLIEYLMSIMDRYFPAFSWSTVGIIFIKKLMPMVSIPASAEPEPMNYKFITSDSGWDYTSVSSTLKHRMIFADQGGNIPTVHDLPPGAENYFFNGVPFRHNGTWYFDNNSSVHVNLFINTNNS